MKKNYLLLAGLASMMAFSACSNDDDLGINPNPVVSEVVEGATFEIEISGMAEGSTKAVRPMGSSAADNNVDCIQLKAYYWDEDADGGAKWVECTFLTSVPEKETPATEGQIGFVYVSGQAQNTPGIMEYGQLYYETANPAGEGVPGTDVHINKKAKVQVVGLSENTKYQFVAYGYNRNSGQYPYTSGPVATTGFENGVFQAGVANTTLTNGYGLQEIFAATDVVETTTNEEDQTVFTQSPSLTLKRQVAGILAYFSHIPARMNRMDRPSDEIYKVDELRVVASHKSKDFYFPAILLDDPDFNGIAADQDEEEVLMTFDFSKIATNYNTDDLTAQDEYTFNKTDAENSKPFAKDYTAPDGLALVEGSIFGARYILPYDKHYSDETTLKLQFWGTNTENTDPVLLEERDITTPNTDLFDAYTYDIRCNNFYSIGQKLATDSTEGPDEDDDDDNDKPIDLRSDNINVRINDAWAVLHNMGVDNIE